MAVGVYGTIRASDINISDIEIFYNYASSREAVSTDMFSLDPADVLTELQIPTSEQLPGRQNLLEGLYNLRLPATVFNATGVYTLYITGKRIYTSILDCGVLSSMPNIRGILLDSNQLDATLRSANALQGFRIEYINSDGTKLRNICRYIVSSNRVSPISSNISNSSQRTVRYTFDDTSNLLFLQLTPSSSSTLKPNSTPFIGFSSQDIILSNTLFSPICLEIVMQNEDIDSIAQLISGEQIKNVNTGELTLFDENRNIKKQFNLYSIKDDVNNALYEIKENKTNINPISFDDIVNV